MESCNGIHYPRKGSWTLSWVVNSIKTFKTFMLFVQFKLFITIIVCWSFNNIVVVMLLM